jgi:hypothetical protein
LASIETPGLAPLEDKLLKRYVVLRKDNLRKEAAEAFTKLKNRYPNKAVRMDLIRFYRKKSPLFLFLYWEERKRIGQELWTKLQSTLDYLIRLFAAPSAQGAGLLQTLKKALRVFPSDKIKAVALVRHFVWVSETFDYHYPEVAHLANGLLDYYGESTIEEPEITLVVPGRRPTQSKASPVKGLDLSKVRFSKKDLEELLINDHVEGAENQTLLYCQKYWLKTEDPDFETKIFLYSKSAGTDHAKIFSLIQDGRRKAQGDDEILFAVFNFLNDDQGYRYNVRRDITMQKIWAKIKPKGKVSLRGDMDLKEYAQLREKKAREEKARRNKRAKELEAMRREKEEQAQREAYERARAIQEKKREIQEAAKERAHELILKAEEKKLKALERQQQEKFQDQTSSLPLKPAIQPLIKTPTPAAKGRAQGRSRINTQAHQISEKRPSSSTQEGKKNLSSSTEQTVLSSSSGSSKRFNSKSSAQTKKAEAPASKAEAPQNGRAAQPSPPQSQPPGDSAAQGFQSNTPEKNVIGTHSSRKQSEGPNNQPTQGESTANQTDEWAAWDSPVDPRVAEFQTHRIHFRKSLEPVIEEFLWNHSHQSGVKLGGGQFSVALITIKEFILSHYLDPNMNWALSNQRQELKSTGLDIVNIDWIMDRCLQVLREKTTQPV